MLGYITYKFPSYYEVRFRQYHYSPPLSVARTFVPHLWTLIRIKIGPACPPPISLFPKKSDPELFQSLNNSSPCYYMKCLTMYRIHNSSSLWRHVRENTYNGWKWNSTKFPTRAPPARRVAHPFTYREFFAVPFVFLNSNVQYPVRTCYCKFLLLVINNETGLEGKKLINIDSGGEFRVYVPRKGKNVVNSSFLIRHFDVRDGFVR